MTKPTRAGSLHQNCSPLTHSVGTSFKKSQKVPTIQLNRFYEWGGRRPHTHTHTHPKQSQSMPLVLHRGRLLIYTPLSDFKLSPLIFLYIQNLAGKAGWELSPRHTHPSPKKVFSEVSISFPLNSRRYPASLLCLCRQKQQCQEQPSLM